MTDIQDQIDVLPRTDDNDGAPSQSQQRARRRSGALTTMLLPELQALAGSLGIASTKVRKSDLIAAIQNVQGRPAAAPAGRTGRTAGAGAGASTQTTPDSTPAADAGRAPAVAVDNRGPAGTAAPVATTTPAAPSAPVAESTASVTKSGGRTRRSATRGSGPVTSDVNGAGPDQLVPADQPPTTDRSVSESTDRPRPDADLPATAVDRNGVASANRNGAATVDRDGAATVDRDGAAGANLDPGAQNGAGSDRDSRADRNRSQRDGSRQAEARQPAAAEPQRDRTRPSNDRPTNDRPSNDRPNNDRPSNDRSGGGASAGANGNFADSANGTDDDDPANRRPRRYRDRRGRLRERFDAPGASRNDGGRTDNGRNDGGRNDAGRNDGGRGNSDLEPAVTDDDVLIPVAGILDNVDEKSSWFIRVSGYFASPEDVYVANNHIRRYGLRRGDAVTGVIRQPGTGDRKEKFSPLVRLDTVNGVDPELARNRVEFTKLTPLYPQARLRLETEPHILTTRVIDLVMPIGKGQRALVVSPPKAGKTSVLQAIANAIAVNNPECHLMVVLVDERPEEVTDMQRSVKGEVIASTFDRKPIDHTMIAELSIERAKRLVEMGHDVVVLLDSITRLGRAYNLAAPASGRILSGGVDSTALYPPKRFLGAARNIEDGGSLTIIATALIETGSTMDTVIFEEFKGTGNAELVLDRKIADKRVFPAVDVDKSGTRKEELLMSPDELSVVLRLRRVLHALDPQQGIDLLMDRLKKSRTNIEFLMQIAKTSPGNDDR